MDTRDELPNPEGLDNLVKLWEAELQQLGNNDKISLKVIDVQDCEESSQLQKFVKSKDLLIDFLVSELNDTMQIILKPKTQKKLMELCSYDDTKSKQFFFGLSFQLKSALTKSFKQKFFPGSRPYLGENYFFSIEEEPNDYLLINIAITTNGNSKYNLLLLLISRRTIALFKSQNTNPEMS